MFDRLTAPALVGILGVWVCGVVKETFALLLLVAKHSDVADYPGSQADKMPPPLPLTNCRLFMHINISCFFLQLLDCFSLPTVLVLSWLVVRARYRLSHIGGMALALMSVVAIVWIDVDDGKGGVGEGGGSAS